ncbi:MAG TPA: hypothetical protein VFY17_00900 [Pilimelia sp.]|nr:hypothetical protein [Pilimelia sp.]
MRYLTVLAALGVAALGVAGVVHGEADDSPGLQLIGVVLVAGAAVGAWRVLRRARPGR